MVQDGRPLPEADVRPLWFVFSEKTLAMHVGGKLVAESAYTIDARTRPATIDMVLDGRTTAGIYEVAGPSLRICLNDSGKRRLANIPSAAGKDCDVDLLLRRPDPPSVPGLKHCTPVRIPGLEEVDPGFSPCLTADLKTIVFAAMLDLAYGYDLYIATRDDVTRPFATPRLIRTTVSAETEAYPTLSPDGRELIFARSDRRPLFFRATRPSLKDEFGKPALWPVPGYDVDAKQRVERPQFLGDNRVMFCFVELSPARRRMLAAQRPDPKSPFGPPAPLPFVNAWHAWFLAESGLRAYYGGKDGLFMASRRGPADTFGNGVRVLSAAVTGPIEGPIWVTPREDLLFYCSTGPGEPPDLGPMDRGRRLWMIQF